MLYKSFPAEFKAEGDGDTFEGYASVFGNIDQGGDRVLPGAFAKTISERQAAIRVLWQHSWFDPIGRPIHMEEDSHGLLTRSQVSWTTLGRDALTLIRDGVVDQLSIGYEVIKDAWDRDEGTRDLVEVKLWEYSPVTFAMNELATINGVKTVDELQDLLRKASFLTEHGLKDGRVLSRRNLSLVKQAYEALGSLIEVASQSDEPDESTQSGDGDSKADPEVDAKEPGTSTPTLSGASNPFEGVIAQIEELGGWSREQKLVEELRDFGQQLRTGGG